LKVRHTKNGRTVTLPPGYVGTASELGYATTVHGAQGVTVATMHGLATGHESRQQLYTMLTRGRSANHLYVPVVGDGDQHTILPRSRPISARLYVQATRFHMSNGWQQIAPPSRGQGFTKCSPTSPKPLGPSG
jgi:hypothetical protein